MQQSHTPTVIISGVFYFYENECSNRSHELIVIYFIKAKRTYIMIFLIKMVHGVIFRPKMGHLGHQKDHLSFKWVL